MNGLVVVHVGLSYLNSVELGEQTASNNRLLFEKIAYEMDLYQKGGGRLFFLAEECGLLALDSIPLKFRRFIPFMDLIPNLEIDEGQFLTAKEKVLIRGVTSVEVCGLAYDSCVSDLYHLFLGEEGPDSKYPSYSLAGQFMGWSGEKLRRVFNTKIISRIREDLTDRCFFP